MEIRVNGQTRDVEDDATVGGLLEQLGVPADGTAVEINGELLGPDQRQRPIAQGDRVEIVRFVGGG